MAMRAACVAAVLTLAAGCVGTGRDAESSTSASSLPPSPGMVWIPGGVFRMGGDDPLARPDESPVHEVRISGFWIDAT